MAKVYSRLEEIPKGTASDKITEGDMEKLGELYWLGYQDGMDNTGLIRNYLG